MIIYIKKHEVNSLIKHLEDIEYNFWLQYKQRSNENREILKSDFEEMYKKLYELIEGEQLTIDAEDI